MPAFFCDVISKISVRFLSCKVRDGLEHCQYVMLFSCFGILSTSFLHLCSFVHLPREPKVDLSKDVFPAIFKKKTKLSFTLFTPSQPFSVVLLSIDTAVFKNLLSKLLVAYIFRRGKGFAK